MVVAVGVYVCVWWGGGAAGSPPLPAHMCWYEQDEQRRAHTPSPHLERSYRQGDESVALHRRGIGCGQDGGGRRLRGVQPGEGHTSKVWRCHTHIRSGSFCVTSSASALPPVDIPWIAPPSFFPCVVSRFSSPRRRKIDPPQLGRDVSAGLVTVRLRFSLHGNGKSWQHIATTGGAQHSAVSWGRGARGVNEYSYQGGKEGTGFHLTRRKGLGALSRGFKVQFVAL